MARRKSDETKQRQGLGTGEGADYLPYITTGEFNSLGTTTVIRDWKTGRGVHCLSQGELLWYYILRWDDTNVDIREQFPLNNEATVDIANQLGVRHPRNRSHIMTTDFLVTKDNGNYHAYSVKPDKELTDRQMEILCIEKMYWECRGVPFSMLFKTDVDSVMAHNIRLVTEYYDPLSVFDAWSAVKHRIATKQITYDMSSEVIDNKVIQRLMKEDIICSL